MHREFIAKVRENLQLAEDLFDIDMSDVLVEIRMRGHRCAGKAWWKTQAGRKHFGVRFHPLAVKKYWREMIQEVIPHEVAHVVCYKRPELGRNHNQGWKRVCRMLGGTSERCHSFDLSEARINKRPQVKYRYRATCGQEVTLSGVRHSRIQRGTVYRVRGGGRILQSGYIGRTREHA